MRYRCLLVSFLLLFLFVVYSFAQELQVRPILPQAQSGFFLPSQPMQPSLPMQSYQTAPTITKPSQEGLMSQEMKTPEIKAQDVSQAEKSQEVLSKESKPTEPELSQATPPQLEELSDFERFIIGRFPREISFSGIRQFGYDLFVKPPSTFAPSEMIPVSPDYVIGPGDEIRISIWGKIDGQWSVVVDREGNINLPKIGVLGVAGLTFRDLKELLYKEFSKYYIGFEMNVSMGRLRTITVYVVGNVKNPGAYTVSSLATLVNALFAAGGPNKVGTMRDIQVKRNGQTIVHFDLYDFLLKGDKTRDIRLMPEDVIFIPPIGPRVAIAGNVKRPAIYELKGPTTIRELIEMAGGLTASAYIHRIQVERIFQSEVKIILDVDFKELKEKDIYLQDGDIVKIFPITNIVINAVTLQGHVTKPGQYQWFEGMRISDLIKNPVKDLLPETYFEHALIERYVEPDYHLEIISFNLGKALFEKDPNENKLLKPYDKITIYSVWDFKDRPVVRISGAVHKPGTYELRKNMKVSDLVKLAGGPKYFAYLKEAELTRVTPTPSGPITEKIIINLEKVLSGDQKADIYLQQDDYLFVRTVPEWDLYQTVTITGEVRFPGTYTIKKGETLSTLLERAGGFTDKAYPRGAVFIRQSVRELQQKQIDEMVDRLERELLSQTGGAIATASSAEEAQIYQREAEQKRLFIQRLRQIKALGRIVVHIDSPEKIKGTPWDIILEDGDSIHIPSLPSAVQVIGSVYNQNAFLFDPKKGVYDYIELAGGFTEGADKSNIFILKVDGSAVKPGKGLLSWNKWAKRWEFGTEIEPGDTIVVPEKLYHFAWIRNIKDITQILYQIAVAAGVIIAAF